MWKCPKCGEGLKDDFEVCWSCGTNKQGVLDPNFLDPEAAPPAPENEPLERLSGDVDEDPEPLVTIAQCNLNTEAYAMRVFLEAEGIPVFLADELTVDMVWILSNAVGGIKVQVPEHLAERATALLANFTRFPNANPSTDEEESEKT
jgi:hypothetical protein